jgi:hypothetical protein
MQQPISSDVVLGGKTPQSSTAVLGGIEGARQRVKSAKTFKEKSQAIQELRAYSPEEARVATQHLLKFTLNISPEAIHATNQAMRSLANLAASQEVQDRIIQYNNEMARGFQVLGRSLVNALANVQPPVAELINNLAAFSATIPEEALEALHEIESTPVPAKKPKTKNQKSAYLQGVEKLIGKRKPRRF